MPHKHANGEIKVESGIPMPPPRVAPRAWKYPWHEMAAGDSFFISGADKRDIERARQAAWHTGNRYGFKFTTRREGDGIRVWRLS